MAEPDPAEPIGHVKDYSLYPKSNGRFGAGARELWCKEQFGRAGEGGAVAKWIGGIS